MRHHRPLFFKIVSAFTHSPDDRDDLFQDIPIQVWYSIPNFNSESPITTWLYRVSLNTAIKWTRKERKHSEGRESIDHVDIFYLKQKYNPMKDWFGFMKRSTN